ncbi:MAG: hybrid sensor histidine kinase/response regulator [Candidatus Makaraimicrobium thalassicum]|nr:MAG: hybrid sensor histidine kinase/response regulator [Candidatus Omnitrophota bacterium]
MPFDKSKFIGQFKSETREHIQKLNQGLLKLERAPASKELLEVLMREAHTIKGSATMMGYERITDIAHRMEDGFEKALKQGFMIEKAHFDLLFECLDTIEGLLEDKVTWEAKGINRPYLEGLCGSVERIFSGEVPGKQKKEVMKERGKAKKEDTIPPVISSAAVETIRVGTDRLNKLMNLSGELVISKIRLNELVRSLAESTGYREDIDKNTTALIRELQKADENIDFSTSNIQDEVMNLRMISVSYLFNTFPRAMRDLAREKGKDIELEIRGEDTRLDKTIIDEMKDPVMHLLRNAVDHGIEEPGVREGRNKPASGKIILHAYQKGSQIIIEVSDDGAGIDVNKIREQAVNKGIISGERIAEMADEQIFQLLFTPGFSTKEHVTDVSGRGVGLDVVRERIAKLKGMIEVESKPGAGTRFIMKLPLTLAITESLLVVSGRETFAVPIDAIVETIRVTPKEIKTVETKEAITVRGHIIPLIRLNEIFGISPRGISEKKFFPVVVVQYVEKRAGLLVDRLLGRQEIIGKSLGKPLKKLKNIAGGTILGDGSIIFILNIPSIIESAEGAVVKKPGPEPARHPAKKKQKTILLAEDVLSTAMLEKNILESAGFSVVVARDGDEALKRVSQEKFDLIITDILMPKMDGFELTERLKKDKLYKDIPVIIVTTREGDADKRRGLKAGAEAYILKREFTSEGLLDILERLIG